MKNLSNDFSNLMINKNYGKRFKSLANEVFKDDEVQSFLKEHKEELDHKTIIKSISKLYEFVVERNKVISGKKNMIPGYKPKLEISKNLIDVVYLPTQEKIESINRRKMFKKLHLISLPKGLRNIKLEDFDTNGDAVRENAYYEVLNFITDYRKNPKKYHQGIYLYGEFGVGKTFLMSAMANELVKSGYEVMLLNFPDFTDDMKNSIIKHTVHKKVDKIKKTPFLIFDDIGADDMSSWIRDNIISVILDYRMQNSLPTFFTSNYSMEQFQNEHLKFNNSGDESTIKSQRIMQRVRYLSKQCLLTGDNRRPQ